MNNQKLMELAHQEGFLAAVIEPEKIPVDGKFRVFCEENRCGKYHANYSCPPDCGTVEELHQKLLGEERALILEKQWPIQGYEDKAGIEQAKREHNAMVLRLLDKIRQAGMEGFCSGYNGCPLCTPCRQVEGKPCAFPEKRISCMSAYCVDVAELARRCELPFAWDSNMLHLFGMIVLHDVR